jgi:hypothetical protein
VFRLQPDPVTGDGFYRDFYQDYVRRETAQCGPADGRYLFQVAQSVLILHHSIPDGKTMDSPQGKLKIEQSGVPGRRTLILEPARSG